MKVLCNKKQAVKLIRKYKVCNEIAENNIETLRSAYRQWKPIKHCLICFSSGIALYLQMANKKCKDVDIISYDEFIINPLLYLI